MDVGRAYERLFLPSAPTYFYSLSADALRLFLSHSPFVSQSSYSAYRNTTGNGSAGYIRLGEIDKTGRGIRESIDKAIVRASLFLQVNVLLFFCQIACARERLEFRTTLVPGRCYDYLLTNRNDLCLKASTSFIIVLRKIETNQWREVPICYLPIFVYSGAWKINVASTRWDDRVKDTTRDRRPQKTGRTVQRRDFSVAIYVRVSWIFSTKQFCSRKSQ